METITHPIYIQSTFFTYRKSSKRTWNRTRDRNGFVLGSSNPVTSGQRVRDSTKRSVRE